jgi:hypothetical protein
MITTALSRERQIDADAARLRQRRDADVASFIMGRLQTIVWKPMALPGRHVTPKPAVADFLDFFTRDRMTVFVVAALLVIPAMDQHHAIAVSFFAAWRTAWRLRRSEPRRYFRIGGNLADVARYGGATNEQRSHQGRCFHCCLHRGDLWTSKNHPIKL